MNRLDRYYIPPGVPARPPAPPLPRKGILMMPPPLPPQNPLAKVPQHQYPSHLDYQQPHSSAGSNWSYQANPNLQPMMQQQKQLVSPANLHSLAALSLQNIPSALQFPAKIRPDRMSRMPLPRLVGAIDYEELPPLVGGRLDSQNLATAMSLPDSSPRQALQRILLLYENGEHREAAAFMRRLSFQTFKQILPQLPADIFVESMPHSLPILEALYAKIFLGSGNQPAMEAKILGRANSLRPEAVVWQLVKFFAGQEEEMSASGQMRWEFCGPFISSCKRLLAVILEAQPRSRRVLAERRRALMKAIEGLGQHSLVGTSEGQLMNLHNALKIEFEKVQKRYCEALQKLETLSLCTSTNGTGPGKATISAASGAKAPIAQSHQRQLSLKASEIQERLIKNKTLLNVVEPTLENTSMEVLLGILQQRIELDKECLFQFTQVKKESHLSRDTQSVAPILMRYQRGCQQVLELMKEVSEDKDEESESSDISGYHSDSESAVMTSGNSPFISKEARYSFLSRSVRLGSKHNIRASILASSICLETASSRGGSIKSVPATSLRSRGLQAGPPSLVLHSSSGVSSGSTTSSDDNADSSKQAPDSPSPSCSSSGTVKQRPPTAVPVNPMNRVAQRQRLMKPRPKEVYKISIQGSTSSSIQSSNFCQKCEGTESVASTSPGEPVYQGIIERDISVIRKETEIASLTTEVSSLKTDLNVARKTIFSLQDQEKRLKDRLITEQQRYLTLEKLTKEATAKTDQQQQQKNKTGYTVGDQRPAALVKKYGELYSQTRLETLDALDKLPELINSDELKNKLLFSVVVLAFRSVSTSIQSKRDQIRRILQLPPPAATQEDKEKTKADQEVQNGDGTTPVMNLDQASRDMEDAVTSYLRRATETFDLSKNVEEVCTQIWATLYDYPCLKSCDGIIRYVKECVRLAWGLVNQHPVYTIEFENRHFRSDLHVRYHSSDVSSDMIKTYLWPALLEGKDGPCVQKGVIIT